MSRSAPKCPILPSRFLEICFCIILIVCGKTFKKKKVTLYLPDSFFSSISFVSVFSRVPDHSDSHCPLYSHSALNLRCGPGLRGKWERMSSATNDPPYWSTSKKTHILSCNSFSSRQVGCMPWLWGSASTNSSIVIIDDISGANHTMAELPCEGARYAFLSCVVGTLTLALFLRVSWLPKMALMLLLGVLYITVLELSGFRSTPGWGSRAQTHTHTHTHT